MDIIEIRMLNARYWCDALGRGALAEKLGYKDTIYLNQLYIGSANVGARTARKFDKQLGLETGWMDAPHPDLWESKDPSRASLVQEQEAASALIRRLSPEALRFAHLRIKAIAEQDGLPVKTE